MNSNDLYIPDSVLRDLAKCFLPDIIKFYETDEGKRIFEEWKKENAEVSEKQKKDTKEKTE